MDTRKKDTRLGRSQSCVIGQGIKQVGDCWILIGHDGTLRFFAEVTADPDRAEVRPTQAYRDILASMHPGWTLRVLRLLWPDPPPRILYRDQIEKWDPDLRLTTKSRLESGQDVEEQPVVGVGRSEGLSILYEGLKLHVDSAPLPYMRRTVWEYAVPAAALENSLAWWNSLPGLLAGYGFEMVHLDGEDIQLLAHWVFNPKLTAMR